MKEKIIVIGGGFAGIQFIQNLKKNTYEITLIDKSNHHQFQPLFYQVATSQIEPSNISFPFRKIFYGRKDVDIRLAEVSKIDTNLKRVTSDIGEFSYDKLVIATGCSTNYFGNEGIKQNSLSLKTTLEAIAIRNRIIESFESMLSCGPDELEKLKNLVIVGAGPTGVELAGSFAELKRDILPNDYPTIDFSDFKIILLEGSDNTLNAMSEKSKSDSRRYLEKMGVDIMTGVFVKEYDGSNITLSSGESIKTANVIWAAGVKGNLPSGISDDLIIQNNRIKVDRFNQVMGLNDVFALGDIATMATPKYPNGHPQLANVAINQAVNTAKNISKRKSDQWVEYEYQDLGSMATIGRNKAVVDFPFLHLRGYFAWVIWMFLHLMLILNVRNKLIIFINWAGNYLTKNSSLRLILKERKK